VGADCSLDVPSEISNAAGMANRPVILQLPAVRWAVVLPDGSTAVSAALRYPETQSVEEFNHQSKSSNISNGLRDLGAVSTGIQFISVFL